MTPFKTVDGIIVMSTIVQGVSTFRTVYCHLSRDDNNNVLGKCFVSKMDISIFYSSNKRITEPLVNQIFSTMVLDLSSHILSCIVVFLMWIHGQK